MKQMLAAAHRTRWGRLVLGLMALLLAYALALEAIDTARLVYYFLTIVLVVFGIRWLVTAFKTK